jgi:hypothetical protein
VHRPTSSSAKPRISFDTFPSERFRAMFELILMVA